MRSIATLALVIVGSAAIALPASASKFSPASTSFSATGLATVTTPGGTAIKCKLTLKGATTATGKAKITKATIAPGLSICTTVKASGLPWAVVAGSASTGTIKNISLVTPLGNAGPANVKFTDNSSGVWTIAGATLPPGYTLAVALPTTPAITIVP